MIKDTELAELDRKLREIGSSSSRKMNKLMKYEPYIVPLLAFLIVISGLAAGIIERSAAPAGPAGFVVIDLTDTAQGMCREDWFCSDWTDCTIEGIQARECLDFNGCGTGSSKPAETRECTIAALAANKTAIKAELPAITGFAALPFAGSADLLLLLIYAIVVVSVAVIAVYVFLAYIVESPLHHSLVAFAYWLAMAGVPLSVYYAVTRKQSIAPAYAGFIVVIVSFAILMVLKPWAPPALKELKHIDSLLERRSGMMQEDVKRLRESRQRREKELAVFRQKLAESDRRRELELGGVREFEIDKLNREISQLMKKERKAKKSLEEVEHSVKEREKSFGLMNEQLRRWAEERRTERLAAEKARKEKELAEKKETREQEEKVLGKAGEKGEEKSEVPEEVEK